MPKYKEILTKNVTLNEHCQTAVKPTSTGARMAFDKSEQVTKVELPATASAEQAAKIEQVSQPEYAKALRAEVKPAMPPRTPKTEIVPGDSGGLFKASELLKRVTKKGS